MIKNESFSTKWLDKILIGGKLGFKATERCTVLEEEETEGVVQKLDGG